MKLEDVKKIAVIGSGAMGHGIAQVFAQARQLVRKGHGQVNGRTTNSPSFQVKPSMEITLKEGMRANTLVNEALDTAQGRGVPPWLELDAEGFRGKVLSLPSREDIRLPIQEQLIVELYSR